MDSDRVDVLHRAYDDRLARCVAHGLELYFLPAGNAFLNQYLRDRRKVQSVLRDRYQFLVVIRDSAAGSSECECRTDDHRIANLISDLKRFLHGFRNARRHARLSYSLHRIPEEFAVLRLVDCVDIGPQELNLIFVKNARACKLHRERKSGLAAEPRKEPVGPFFFNYPCYGFKIQRLEIYLIRQVLIRHDRSGIGVDQHDIYTLVLKDAARLRAGIVEFRRLSDNYRSRAYHQDLLDALILRHLYPPLKQMQLLLFL